MDDVEIYWRVDNLEWDIAQGGIISAQWSVVARQDGVEGSTPKRSSFSPDPSSESFISINDVTEEQVLEWIRKSLAQNQIEIYESQAKDALLRAKLPPLVSGLPWKM